MRGAHRACGRGDRLLGASRRSSCQPRRGIRTARRARRAGAHPEGHVRNAGVAQRRTDRPSVHVSVLHPQSRGLVRQPQRHRRRRSDPDGDRERPGLPVLLAAPSAAGAPTITGSTGVGSPLSCSAGSWRPTWSRPSSTARRAASPTRRAPPTQSPLVCPLIRPNPRSQPSARQLRIRCRGILDASDGPNRRRAPQEGRRLLLWARPARHRHRHDRDPDQGPRPARGPRLQARLAPAAPQAALHPHNHDRTLTRIAHPGLDKVPFTGRIHAKALKPGRYQAVFTANTTTGASPTKHSTSRSSRAARADSQRRRSQQPAPACSHQVARAPAGHGLHTCIIDTASIRTGGGDRPPLRGGWLVNPLGVEERYEHAKTGLPTDRPGWACLVVSCGRRTPWPKGQMWAAGRSLPEMSLAFALMAAINGSTGSCATLSHGLSLPHQASPASARRPRKFSPLIGGGARGRQGRCRTNRGSRCRIVTTRALSMLRRPADAQFPSNSERKCAFSRHSPQPLISSEARALSAFDSAGTWCDTVPDDCYLPRSLESIVSGHLESFVSLVQRPRCTRHPPRGGARLRPAYSCVRVSVCRSNRRIARCRVCPWSRDCVVARMSVRWSQLVALAIATRPRFSSG